MNFEDRTGLIQAGQAPPKLLIERRESGQVLCLRFSGSVDEQFDGPGLARTLRARFLVLDLGGIDRISSFGIRQWIDFIGGTAGLVEALYFVEVSPKMVDQFNMVANFGGPGHIVSFFAPYRCDSCDHDRRRLLRTDEETPLWRAGQAPAFACPSCGGQEYFDEDPATYFSYVGQQAPAALPAEVGAFLRSELSYGQGGQRKLKIEKRVDGRTTHVKLSGDLDSDLRAQKLADGLEGEVIFDLGGVLSIDPVGTAQWRKLMQLLDGKSGAGGERVERVHLLATPALFLERLGRPEEITRKGQVLSVLVPYTCPRCRATTQRLVDFAAHGNELRAGRVPRTQCAACGGPANCVASETWLTRLAALPQPQVGDTLRQTLSRLQAAPAPRSGAPLATAAAPARSWPPSSPSAPAGRPEAIAQEPPARDTRPLGMVRFARLRGLFREVLQVPGLIPGLLVVLLALSAAVVYRILSPPEGRRNAAGLLVLESSLQRPPPWVPPPTPQPGELVFVSQSSLLPSQRQALEQAEGAAFLQLARRLGEALAQKDRVFRDTVWTLYEDGLGGAKAEKRSTQEVDRRIAALLRQAPVRLGRPDLYWERLARGDQKDAQELSYQATARLEVSAATFDRLLSHYGRPESCHKALVYPYFPMLGLRFDLPSGALIAQVDPQGRLGLSGILARDVVSAVASHEVTDAADLCRRLDQIGQAGEAALKVQRGERLLDIALSTKARRPFKR